MTRAKLEEKVSSQKRKNSPKAQRRRKQEDTLGREILKKDEKMPTE